MAASQRLIYIGRTRSIGTQSLNRNIPALDLLKRVQAGEPAAIGRLISRAEGGKAEDREALAQVYKLAGRAHVVGLTGVPGSGKSTLVSKIAQLLRQQGRKIGVVAVDPSSPYSGGSILGDRVRMGELAGDEGIYIRSMASRGAGGGMARATLDAVDILDVAGYDTIIIETVGVGQDEVEIARASHTTVVVSAPGLGDDIQAIKAGILEIADIHVVSKCDRPEARSAIADLQHMRMHKTIGGNADWSVPVIGTSALTGQGLEDLAAALGKHRHIAFDTDLGRSRLKAIAEFRLRKTAEAILLDRFKRDFAERSSAFTEKLLERKADPYSMALSLLNEKDKPA